MSLLGMNQTQRGGPVTTEWDDTLRKHGILPPLEEPASSEAAEDHDVAPPAPAARASDAADEDEEDELARLRSERLAELKGGGSSGRFGKVLPLSHADYTAEVNRAGEGVAVVVFLSKQRHYLSAYTLVMLEQLARKFSDVKFMQIESAECIPGYPDRNLPTLFVYRDDDLLAQCIGPAAFGGQSFGIDDVEWELAQAGIVTTDLKVNPHAKPHK